MKFIPVKIERGSVSEHKQTGDRKESELRITFREGKE